MKIFDALYLDGLVQEAKVSGRLRQHRNIHTSYLDACQRLFNAIEPDSYIQPHRHASVPREELLMAVRGLMALITFDDVGQVTSVQRFGSEAHGADVTAGVEVSSSTWHTVVALVPGSVLLEIKAGPFDPSQPKDMASWAPVDGTAAAATYLQHLRTLV